MRDIGRLLVILGAITIVVGIVLATGNRLNLGRLPGDIVYKRGSFGCYFPLMTSILLSIIISLIMWFFRR